MKIADFSSPCPQPGVASAGGGGRLKAASKSPGSTISRPDSSFKIKDSLLREESRGRTVVKVQAPVRQAEKIEAREPFDETGVVAAFERYAAEHSPEQTVILALRTHRPLVEGEKIVLPVDNQLQLEKLKAIQKQLANVVMKNLKNGFVTLEFRLFDTVSTQEEKKLFTSGERFEHFVRLNPVVADLKIVFGLELE